MKSKRTIFPPIISVIYIVTVLAFVISMVVEYKSSPAKIQARIDELVRATTQNLSVNQANSEEFQSAFLHSVGLVSDIAGIQLSQNDYLIVSYPANLAENSPTRSPFVTVTERSIYAQNQDAVQLKVASYLIQPSSMYTKGLIAFFVILAATLFCVTYLIYLYSSEKNTFDDGSFPEEKKSIKKNKDTKPSKGKKLDDEALKVEADDEYLDPVFPEEDFGTTEDEDYAEETVQDFPEEDAFDAEYADEEKTTVMNDVQEAEDTYESDFQMPPSPSSTITQEEFQALTQDLLDDPVPEEDNRNEMEDDLLDDLVDDDEPEKSILPELNPIHTRLDNPVQEEKEELNETETAKTDVIQEDKNLPLTSETAVEAEVQGKKHPAGLFSPTTGFGWEEYMIPRLDSELIRAASGDQDLTVMTLEIPKMDWTSDSAREICDLILDLVKFKDLVFEYGQSGCTAIIQNMGIEEALKAAEDLHTNIIASLARRKQYYIVAIGLSARSLRLISGIRIAKESEQALFHALEDKSNPVVAFKVNPEKYRDYIAKESSKLKYEESEAALPAVTS